MVVTPALWIDVTHISTRASLAPGFLGDQPERYRYFVCAKTAGGGVGSSDPCNEISGAYCLLDGLTGLFGSSERSLALMLGGVGGDFVARGAGDGVGRSSMGRAGAA